MAKQIEDSKTPDMLGEPKRRGRPATGQAMSAAERKRRQRERDQERLDALTTAPHKLPPRLLLEVLEHPKQYGRDAALSSWLEIGERMGWITSADRGAILKR